MGANGTELAVSATQAGGWLMTRDNTTGLVWEMKTDDGSIHDWDNYYAWCDTNPTTNGGNHGACVNNADTMYFIGQLNAAVFGGFSDWRLPTVNELSSLVDSGRTSLMIDTAYFPYTKSSYYWSSTTYASNTYGALYVDFDYGYVRYSGKGNGFYARAERRGQ